MNFEAMKQDIDALKAYAAGKILSKIKFDFRQFGQHRSDGENHHHPEADNYCGTKACAAGIMALAPNSGYHTEWSGGELSFWYGSESFDRAIMEKWGLQEPNEHELAEDQIETVWLRRRMVTSIFIDGASGQTLPLIIAKLDDLYAEWQREDAMPSG